MVCEGFVVMFQVTLKGPFSPLEGDVVPLAPSRSGMRCTVSNESVNCVMLDENPENCTPRLLICSRVTQSRMARNINLFTTTIMPDVPGIDGLISILFTPRAEFRYVFYLLYNFFCTHSRPILQSSVSISERSSQSKTPSEEGKFMIEP